MHDPSKTNRPVGTINRKIDISVDLLWQLRRSYRKAADKGGTGAQVKFGRWYDIGKGVQPRFEEAAQWYHKAAD